MPVRQRRSVAVVAVVVVEMVVTGLLGSCRTAIHNRDVCRQAREWESPGPMGTAAGAPTKRRIERDCVSMRHPSFARPLPLAMQEGNRGVVTLG